MTPHLSLTTSDVPLLLEQLRQERFFGSLEIKLEAGDVVLLRKTETIKPGINQQGRNHRDNRGQREYAND